MRKVYYAVTEGKSLTSKLIEFWTRSNRSHALFINPEYFDGTVESLYQDGSLIEAWKYPDESLFRMRVIYSRLDIHSKGTKFYVYELPVTDDQYMKIMNFQNICAYLEVPYDWKAIVGFVLRFKMRNNGKLFCSEKECLSLKYAGLLDPNFPCWRVSPADFEFLLWTLNAKRILTFTTE